MNMQSKFDQWGEMFDIRNDGFGRRDLGWRLHWPEYPLEPIVSVLVRTGAVRWQTYTTLGSSTWNPNPR